MITLLASALVTLIALSLLLLRLGSLIARIGKMTSITVTQFISRY